MEAKETSWLKALLLALALAGGACTLGACVYDDDDGGGEVEIEADDDEIEIDTDD